MSNKYSDALLSAIDIIATKKVSSAQYDKTIVAQIIEALNTNENKYLLAYDGASIEGYAREKETYSEGEMVYVLIPLGDMAENKQIIGRVKSLAKKQHIILWKDTKGILVENGMIIGYVDQNDQQIMI